MYIVIFQYETMSATLGSSPMRHTLEALGDVSTMNAGDLKIRIEEMLRIKVITTPTWSPTWHKNDSIPNGFVGT